ncbi:MAG: hypothetical protein K9L62_02250 [Vallitaleaceae bacterium]|nr:hypothetical protein [Vallitaleaceae bacterium]
MYIFECGSIVYDGSELSIEEISQSVVIEELPIPEERPGFYPQIRANVEEQSVYYEYLPTPEEPTPEPKTEIEILQEKLDIQDEAIMELAELLSGVMMNG